MIALQPLFVALVALLSCRVTPTLSMALDKRTGSPWSGLQINDGVVDDYCTKPQIPASVDRRACFTYPDDVTTHMTASDHIYGFRKADGTAWVVLADLPQSGAGPWTIGTDDLDITINADKPECLSVHVVTYDLSGSSDDDPAKDIVSKIQQFEQCPGDPAISVS